MSKLTKLTKAVPAKKTVASKNAVNSRYFTTPTVGDWVEEMDGIDELLAEFYIQSRDISGTGVVDPINIGKLLNMVGLNAVVVSGVNNEDYSIRCAFTGSDVCGNILLENITSKFIARNPDVINQLLDIELAYNGNAAESVEITNGRTVYLFPNVVDIAKHSDILGGALGAIRTWAEQGIRINSSNFSVAEDSALQRYMSDLGLTLNDYRELVTIDGVFTGSIDGEIFGPFYQITSGLPLDQVNGIGGDQCDGGKTLVDVMASSLIENYYANDKPTDGSTYWGRLNVACFFFGYSKVLAWIVDNITSPETLLLSVLEDFDTLSEGYLYDELTLDERVEVLRAKSIAVLVHILNDEEEVEDLVTSIIAHKSSGLTTLSSASNLPTTPRPGVPAASEDERKFFGVLSQVVEQSTHTERKLSFDDLDGSEYAALFYFTRAPAPSTIITISSRVSAIIYTTSNFTESGNKLSDANIASLLEALGLTDSDALDINLGSLTASSTDAIAQGKLVTLFAAFGAGAVLRLVVVTANTINWNHGKTVLALYLQIVGSDTNTADSMMRHIYDAMNAIKTVRGIKATIQAAAVASSNANLLKGLLRLLDHGAEPSEIYELLGISETDRRANVKLMAEAVATVPSGEHRVDWRKVNELIQLAGIKTFIREGTGVMNIGSTANMLNNWALAFADTDAEIYAELRDAGFEAWELLTYTRTTNVYKVENGRAVKGADETTMAFNLDWVCDAYNKTLAQLQKEAYDNYGITLAVEEDN